MEYKDYLIKALNRALEERKNCSKDSVLYGYYCGKISAYESALTLLDIC